MDDIMGRIKVLHYRMSFDSNGQPIRLDDRTCFHATGFTHDNNGHLIIWNGGKEIALFAPGEWTQCIDLKNGIEEE